MCLFGESKNVRDEGRLNESNGVYVSNVYAAEIQMDQNKPPMEEQAAARVQQTTDIKSVIMKYAGKDMYNYFKKSMQDNWIYAHYAAHTLFKSPRCYSANIANIEYLKILLNKIAAKEDRLPIKESLEGLKVLRSAWDVIDIGQVNLRVYKYLSKFIYLFILLSGIATVCDSTCCSCRFVHK
jgi:hypothetical protein